MSYNTEEYEGSGNSSGGAGGDGGRWGMVYLIILWIVCAYFGVYFTSVQDGM